MSGHTESGRHVLLLVVLMVLWCVVTLNGAISLVGIWHGYDVWGKLAMSAGWLLVSGMLTLGVAIVYMGTGRWQAYFAAAAFVSVLASFLYWRAWATSQDEADVVSGLFACAAWAAAALAAGMAWSRLIHFGLARRSARVE